MHTPDAVPPLYEQVRSHVLDKIATAPSDTRKAPPIAAEPEHILFQ